MNFCNNCGKQLADNETFCAGCGSPAGNQQNAQNTNAGGGNINQTMNNFMNTPNSTGEFDGADIEANKILALLSYLGILVLVPIFAAPQSKFARFHANQGVVLIIVELILGFAAGLLTGILFFIPVIGWIIGGLLSTVVGIASLAFTVIGIINAVNGQAKELPIIGKYRILK